MPRPAATISNLIRSRAKRLAVSTTMVRTPFEQQPLQHRLEGRSGLNQVGTEDRLVVERLDDLTPRSLGVGRDGRAPWIM